MFYIKWLETQYDSAFLTYLKNIALLLPPIALVCYLSAENAKYKIIRFRQKKYDLSIKVTAIVSTLIFTLAIARVFMK